MARGSGPNTKYLSEISFSHNLVPGSIMVSRLDREWSRDVWRETSRFILISLALVFGLIALYFLLAWPAAKTKGRTNTCRLNFETLRTVIDVYRTAFNQPLPVAVCDQSDKPILSGWVLLLQFIPFDTTRVDTSAAWDSPINQNARDRAPTLFRCHEDQSISRFASYVLVRDDLGSLDEKILPKETCVVELHGYSEWLKPETGPLLKLSELLQAERLYRHAGIVRVLRCDGTISEFRQ